MTRVLAVLLAVLGMACASGTNFSELPLPARIVLLVGACVFAGALQVGNGIKKNLGVVLQAISAVRQLAEVSLRSVWPAERAPANRCSKLL
jgi:hypothetical protein